MSPDDRYGVVTQEAEGVRLQFRRSWPDPVEDVWSALTEPGRMARWIGTFEGPRAVGATGTFTMTHEEQQVPEPVTVLECDPPHRLVVHWEGGTGWTVALDLTSEAGGTVLLFTQVFDPGTDVTEFAGGWHWYLDKLDAEVSGRPQPAAWDAFWAEVGPRYGHPPA